MAHSNEHERVGWVSRDPLPTNVVSLVVFLARLGIDITPVMSEAFDSVNTSYELVIKHKNRVIEDLRKQLAESGTTDVVTQLPNREACELELTRSVEEERRRAGFAFMFFDCYDFKWYNDTTKDHAVGDAVLRTIGEIANLALRRHDFVGRWGGDEMVAVLHDLPSVEEAVDVAKRFVKAVASYQWQWLDPRLSEHPPQVDVGLLFFSIPSSDERRAMLETSSTIKSELMKRVDALMYEAKEKHRQGIVVVRTAVASFVNGKVVDLDTPDSLVETAVD